MSGRVMFYVQHLLGIGHVRRAAAIAKGLRQSGMDVLMVLGGPPVSLVDFGDIKIRQLPPARAKDARFDVLLDEQDRPIDDAWRRSRIQQLMQLHDDFEPDVLMVELFPFGRRQFRFELIPLLEKAKNTAVTVCSVRDVLVGKKDDRKNRWIVDTARAHFDHILVHGDARIISLDATFPPARQLQDLISYTGYVVENERPADDLNSDGADEIIVSTGGGAVGERLLRTALEARVAGLLTDHKWRFLAGENLETAVFDDLKSKMPSGVIVEWARPDFTALLGRAALSISQGGYNTVMDVLAAGCPNVIVPFAAEAESEQSFRAQAFAQRGYVTVLPENQLTPKSMGRAAARAITNGPPTLTGINLGGVETTARLVRRMARTAETGK